MKQNIDGLIQMTFVNRSKRTIASKVYHEGNSRVSSNIPLPNEKTPYYFFISTGGGFIEGEKYEVDMIIDKEAHAIVTTQAPTYVYKCENGIQTKQTVHIDLKEECTFEYLTDEVIPYKNSIYKQETIIHMKDTSTIALIDGVTAGWSEDEKPFQYTDLQMKTTILMNDRLIYNDHLICEPRMNDMASLGHFEGHSNYNSLIIVSPKCTDEVIERIRQKLTAMDTDIEFGLSTLEKPGFVLRTLGDKSEKNRKVLMAALNCFRIEQLKAPELNLSKNEHYFQK
ncbi:urease accessory protein UreD [Enterococcus sp. AZ072]|uniref:urease accessory protein UreD n=1 Tax=unclassified Enterococcus TaxID=2608891 RepID=UPI003D2CF366